MTKGTMTVREQEEILESLRWAQSNYVVKYGESNWVECFYCDGPEDAEEAIEAHQAGLRKLLKQLAEVTDGI